MTPEHASLQFIRFRPQEASEDDFDALISLFQGEFTELNPGDPLPPSSGTRRTLETLEEGAFYENHIYLVRTADCIPAGWLALSYARPEKTDYQAQKHLALLGVHVAPAMRRQAIGSRMLRFAVERCQESGHIAFEGGTSFESGKAFARRIGASVAIEESYVRVALHDIDWPMIRQWVEFGQVRNPTTRLVRFEGLYAKDDAQLTRFARFISAVRSDVPDGDLEGFVKEITPEQMCQDIAREGKRGITSTYQLAVEAGGRFSGYTRINYRPDFGHVVEQRLTGVLSSERGRGLGKWLKAAMLLHIKDHYPAVTLIRTSYAKTNDPMIAINERIGFKQYRQQVYYKLLVEDVKTYLGIE